MVKIIVEPVPEIYACCESLITAEDIASAVRFQNERRRREHLAWRRVVRGELGIHTSISYNEVGAPIVDRPNCFISVAHGAGMVAVAIAEERVGIDIECQVRDFESAKARFMSCRELDLCDKAEFAGYVWCAKEALYKLYGRRGIDLSNDLQIKSFDPKSETMRGLLLGEPEAHIEILHYDNNIVAVATFTKE